MKQNHIKVQGDLELTILKEDDCFIAYCPALDLSSHGESPEEAKKHLREVIDIFFEETLEMGTLEKALEDCGWERIEDDEPTWIPPAYITKDHFILDKHLPTN